MALGVSSEPKKRKVINMIKNQNYLEHNFLKCSNFELLELEKKLDYHHFGLCAVICERAGLKEEWENSDAETFEQILNDAIEILSNQYFWQTM